MENQYNFLWYPLTSFIEKNNENINFEISEIISPYIEVNMTNINNIQNEIETSDVKVEINPFCVLQLFLLLNCRLDF